MNAEKLKEILDGTPLISEFYMNAKRIIDMVEQEGGGGNYTLIPVLLQYIEDNPSLDYGSPGPFVKFIEKFDQSVYRSYLISSINRRSTTHTVWMLYRLIKSAKTLSSQNELVHLLVQVSEDDFSNAQYLAESFLEDLR